MKRYVNILIAAILALCLLPLPLAAAANNGETDPRQMVVISDRGEHHSLPENSLSAILAAVDAGADMIRISVKETADGYFVLSEDATLARMCGSGDTPISDMTLEDISALKLRAATGGHTKPTEEAPAEMLTVLSEADDTVFLIDFEWESRDQVYSQIDEAGKTANCVFVCRTSAKKAVEWRNSLETPVKIMVCKKTNIIFSALSAIRALRDEDNAYLWLATSNPYGVIFKTAVTGPAAALDGLAVSLADETLSGKRADTDNYREDVVSRGYNMILTGDTAGLAAYKQASAEAQRDMTELLKIEQTRVLPVFKGGAASDYLFAYNNALREALRLSQKGFAGQRECQDAAYALQHAANAIDEDYDALMQGKAGLTITPGRIVTAVIAAAAFIAFECFIHKYRRKNKD